MKKLLMVLVLWGWAFAQLPVTVWGYDPRVDLPFGAVAMECGDSLATIRGARLQDARCYAWVSTDQDLAFRGLMLQLQLVGYEVIQQDTRPEHSTVLTVLHNPDRTEYLAVVAVFLPQGLGIDLVPADY